MDAPEFLAWMEKNNLSEAAKQNVNVFKNIITNCLKAKNEKILIIGDTGFKKKPIAPIITAGYYLAAKELGKNTDLKIQEPKFKGMDADKEVIRSLKRLPKKGIVILSLSARLGRIKGLGKSFRGYAKENNHRFISTTSLGKLKKEKLQEVIKAIDTDYKELQRTGKEIKEKLDKAEKVHITTEAGTNLHFGIKGTKAMPNTGNYSAPKSGGNIPAGEIYIAPRWKDVEGTIIIDGSSSHRGGTQLIKKPIKLTIKKGEITRIEGGEEATNLKNTLEWASKKAKYPWGIRRVGELGIGINPNASIIGATIVDEKTKGTAHIAIGSNYWFGGTIYAIIHLDQVFKNPKIYIDNELLEF